MRADRLVATLLLLQARGRVTAAECAEELEISERTARRDLEALAAAGIPVYSQQGRGGGWSLLGGARTDLTGLTADEARALFLVAGPSSSATPEVKAALRKLVRALPEPFRADAEAASSAVVVDAAAWGRRGPRPPRHLPVLQQAVVEGVQVRLGYAGRERPESERVVHPLGLVAKSGVWYLVAGTDAGMRTFRLSRVRSAEPTGDPVERPEDFDLMEVWRTVESEVDERRTRARCVLLVERDALRALWGRFAERLQVLDRADGADHVRVEVRGPDDAILAGEVAGFGGRVEVLEPDEVRARVAEIGRELVARYGPAASAASTSGTSASTGTGA